MVKTTVCSLGHHLCQSGGEARRSSAQAVASLEGVNLGRGGRRLSSEGNPSKPRGVGGGAAFLEGPRLGPGKSPFTEEQAGGCRRGSPRPEGPASGRHQTRPRCSTAPPRPRRTALHPVVGGLVQRPGSEGYLRCSWAGVEQPGSLGERVGVGWG